MGHYCITGHSRAGMKHHCPFRFRRRHSGDCIAFAVFTGIAAGCQHHTNCSAVLPTHFGFRQRSVDTGFQHRQQIAVQQRQHHLGLGIAEPGVELDDFRPGCRNHQPGIQTALIEDAVIAQTIDHRLQNRLLHFGQQLRRHHRRRRISAHAAGIGPGIAIADPLVVLRRQHRHHGESVGEGQQRRLFPNQTLFQYNLATGIAMNFFQHDFVNRL